MVNILDIDVEINKEKILRNLKFIENTEGYKNAGEIFDELALLIRENMNLISMYSIADNRGEFPLGKDMSEEIQKIVLCFLSSNNNINSMVNDFINEGAYLKGYLLNEMAAHVIFNSSNEMNKVIKKKLLDLGYILTKKYAPGDAGLELRYQKIILDTFKKYVHIDAYLTENYMLVPEKSMMYFFGAKKVGANCDLCKLQLIEDNYLNFHNGSDESCIDCNKLNCQYRKLI